MLRIRGSQMGPVQFGNADAWGNACFGGDHFPAGF
jgi:hypothetical protein